jgi:hypothetical protein
VGWFFIRPLLEWKQRIHFFFIWSTTYRDRARFSSFGSRRKPQTIDHANEQGWLGQKAISRCCSFNTCILSEPQPSRLTSLLSHSKNRTYRSVLPRLCFKAKCRNFVLCYIIYIFICTVIRLFPYSLYITNVVDPERCILDPEWGTLTFLVILDLDRTLKK